MTTAARSLFTEAIEEHLALKKQNAALDPSMPLARYDVGDPLDRYPGGPVRAAGEETVVVAEDAETPAQELVADATGDDMTQVYAGPSPEQAMEAATLLEPTFDEHAIEPLNGMAPMLSLVADIEDETEAPARAAQPAEPTKADVLRFPGGVGPRDEATAEPAPADQPLVVDAVVPPTAAEQTSSMQLEGFGDAPTGEQPVLVIDTNENFASVEAAEVREPSRSERKRSRPRFFGLGRKKEEQPAGDTWFTDGPRDFNWD